MPAALDRAGRASAILRAGEVKVRDMALGERNWPTRVLQISNAYHNQFETAGAVLRCWWRSR